MGNPKGTHPLRRGDEYRQPVLPSKACRKHRRHFARSSPEQRYTVLTLLQSQTINQSPIEGTHLGISENRIARRQLKRNNKGKTVPQETRRSLFSYDESPCTFTALLTRYSKEVALFAKILSNLISRNLRLLAGWNQITRFAKCKWPEISSIKVHDVRTKKKYASNLAVDAGISYINFLLIIHSDRYLQRLNVKLLPPNAISEQPAYGSVEALITGSPEFFENTPPNRLRNIPGTFSSKGIP